MTQTDNMKKRVAELEEELATLKKVNQALMGRVERSVDSSATAFNLFESNIILHQAVAQRTKELQDVNGQLRIEVADRKEAEQRVGAQLEEKEVLLKEIHHRVKNNLQIITSLLDLQARRIADRPTRAMFQDSQTRVKTMALIHERLYRSHNLARVNLRDYVTDLTKFLLSTFSGRNQLVNVVNLVDDIQLPVDQAVPCGLIVNELVSNCLKYAFGDEEHGEITIAASYVDAEMLELCVADNGSGLPADLDTDQLDTLGQKLIKSLTRQIRGSLTYENTGGTRISIRFPVHENVAKGGAVSWQTSA